MKPNNQQNISGCDSSEHVMGLIKRSEQESHKVDNVLLLIVTPARPDRVDIMQM